MIVPLGKGIAAVLGCGLASGPTEHSVAVQPNEE